MSLPVSDFFRSMVDGVGKTLVERDLGNKIVVQVGSATCEHTTEVLPEQEFLFCEGTRCQKSGVALRDRFSAMLVARGIEPNRVHGAATSCFGVCSMSGGEPATYVLARPEKVIYRVSGDEDLAAIPFFLIGGESPPAPTTHGDP